MTYKMLYNSLVLELLFRLFILTGISYLIDRFYQKLTRYPIAKQ